jgi:hypothetical protein
MRFVTPSHNAKVVLNKNIEKWSGFFKNDDEAQKHLDEQLKKIAKNRLVISAKKQHTLVKSTSTGVVSHGLNLYNFSVVLSENVSNKV